MIQLGRSPEDEEDEEDEEEEDEGVGSDESEEHVSLDTDNDGLPSILLDKQPPSVWSCVQSLTLKYVAQKFGFPVDLMRITVSSYRDKIRALSFYTNYYPIERCMSDDQIDVVLDEIDVKKRERLWWAGTADSWSKVPKPSPWCCCDGRCLCSDRYVV
jgi:hypothetical protein